VGIEDALIVNVLRDKRAGIHGWIMARSGIRQRTLRLFTDLVHKTGSSSEGFIVGRELLIHVAGPPHGRKIPADGSTLGR
jgi:hypothetical protein